jgi:cell division protein FtsI (penicillin-binding protein 3)
MKKERFGFIIFFFILFFVILIIRIISISLLPDPRIKNGILKTVSRGTIYDRYNRELAIAAVSYSLYARPSRLPDEAKKAVYSYLLGNKIADEKELAPLFETKNFTWLKRRISSSSVGLVKEYIDYIRKNNPSFKDELGIVPEQSRIYPYPAAANIVGLVGVDRNGLSGLEYSFNSYLDSGYNIQVTLDAELTTLVYDELKKGIIENQADYGSAAIMDVENREILALVNFPSFDPNDYKSITSYNLKNRAVSEIFEPGSVMKQFSAAYALEKKINTPNYPVYQCTGSATIADQEFHCDVSHGSVDLARIIQKSCNIGMIQVADRFKRDEFYHFLTGFGFGQDPGIPLGDTESGILRDNAKWSLVSKYMIAIGQEIGVTAVQLISASSVIAGQGTYKTPLLVRNIADSGGKSVYEQHRKEYQILSPDTTRKLLSMMETVVSENGTAIGARIEGVKIAGKTGTGQVAKEKGGGYYSDLFNAVFVGYVPSNKPRYVIAVVINRPHGDKHTGGLVAAPVFASIIRRMISSTSLIIPAGGN